MLDDCEFKIVHFTYVNILRIDSKYIHLICRSTQKEKQGCKKEDDTQKSMPATPSNITPFSSVAATPTVSTPVSSPQSRPHAASSRPLPSFETPCSSWRFLFHQLLQALHQLLPVLTAVWMQLHCPTVLVSHQKLIA